MQVGGFDWDEGNLAKCQKHGVSIEESLFLGSPRVAPDIKHSEREARQLAIGYATTGRALFVAFTLRERNGVVLLRPISARFMHAKEVEHMNSRKVPHFRTDEDAEVFLQQDLSDLDPDQFKPVKFEFSAKGAQLNMRLPEALLEAVKTKARERGIPYTRYIRQLLEHDISQR